MSDTNQITVRGRVGTDPDLLVTTTGKEVTKFRLASTRSFRDSTTGEWRDTETEWFTVKTWGPAGRAVQESVRRGMPVIVQGALSSEEWESNDRNHHRNVITANAIGVDVKHGRVTFTKVTREVPAQDGGADKQARDGVVVDDEFPNGEFPNGGAAGVGAEVSGADPVLAPEPVDAGAWEKVDVEA